MNFSRAFTILTLCILSACSRAQEKVVLKKIASGLDNPIFLTAPSKDTTRLFVVEKPGQIRIIKDGKILARPFLDIRKDVFWDRGEMGMLGLAFHPKYHSNGYFYIAYTDPQRNVTVVRFNRSDDPEVADLSSAKLLFNVRQPTKHHNGGMLLFGPDGMLYISIGDGGWIGDPRGFAQKKTTIRGHLLRIDVDHGDPYAVPADNPFSKDRNARQEIWFSGLRNPWRFSIDHASNLLYIGDTGEKLREEINVVPWNKAGTNFGWNIMEGTNCFTRDRDKIQDSQYVPAPNCEKKGFTLPVMEYSHKEGCAVIGGYVYRGSELPSIQGHYFYADYCFGWIRSFRYDHGNIKNKNEWNFGVFGNVLSFGEDSLHNLYVLYEEGNIYRFGRGKDG